MKVEFKSLAYKTILLIVVSYSIVASVFSIFIGKNILSLLGMSVGITVIILITISNKYMKFAIQVWCLLVTAGPFLYLVAKGMRLMSSEYTHLDILTTSLNFIYMTVGISMYVGCNRFVVKSHENIPK